jgi:hypothetical protein
MSEDAKTKSAPTRGEVEERLLDLLEGRASRENVAKWAAQWVRMENPPIDDASVWKALTQLSGADMISTDRPYLYDENDFHSWLRELRGQ